MGWWRGESGGTHGLWPCMRPVVGVVEGRRKKEGGNKGRKDGRDEEGNRGRNEGRKEKKKQGTKEGTKGETKGETKEARTPIPVAISGVMGVGAMGGHHRSRPLRVEKRDVVTRR